MGYLYVFVKQCSTLLKKIKGSSLQKQPTPVSPKYQKIFGGKPTQNKSKMLLDSFTNKLV